MSATTFTYTGSLVIIECANCHQDFGVTPRFEQDRRNDHATFYCPSGHNNYYPQKSTSERLRAQLARTEGRVVEERQRAERAERDAARARGLAAQTERSKAALRGHLTRMRNRINAGVCPVPGCKRTNLTQTLKHIKSQHPEWHAEHAHEIEAS